MYDPLLKQVMWQNKDHFEHFGSSNLELDQSVFDHDLLSQHIKVDQNSNGILSKSPFIIYFSNIFFILADCQLAKISMTQAV